MEELSLADLARAEVPLALARLHWRKAPGSVVTIHVATGEQEPGWQPDTLADVIVGAGFHMDELQAGGATMTARATRLRSLPDTVGPGMRLLVCGLNPSQYAADRGVGYARPGNRFWAAARQAGLVTRPHEPVHALTAHGLGMTDLVKRATPRAEVLTRDEFRDGAGRVSRLVEWLRPAAVCFVGLQGWRAAVDRGAVAGVQPGSFGGRPAYVMPSTSGLNAHASLDELVGHLRAAAALARGGRRHSA